MATAAVRLGAATAAAAVVLCAGCVPAPDTSIGEGLRARLPAAEENALSALMVARTAAVGELMMLDASGATVNARTLARGIARSEPGVRTEVLPRRSIARRGDSFTFARSFLPEPRVVYVVPDGERFVLIMYAPVSGARSVTVSQ